MAKLLLMTGNKVFASISAHRAQFRQYSKFYVAFVQVFAGHGSKQR